MPTTEKLKLDKSPDYATLVSALISKTREEKLNWEETARENSFIAAVNGLQIFEVRLESLDDDHQIAVVIAKDSNGNFLFRTPGHVSNLAQQLFDLAERVARRLDERINSSVQLLNSL